MSTNQSPSEHQWVPIEDAASARCAVPGCELHRDAHPLRVESEYRHEFHEFNEEPKHWQIGSALLCLDCGRPKEAAVHSGGELPCAGYEGCHALEGVMYDLFVHDPTCPKSPEQRRAPAERRCVKHCSHDPRFYKINPDPRAAEENKLGPMCWYEDDDGFCGHRCAFTSPAGER